MESVGRRVVLVSGAPGSGKTTLAVPLAAGLGFALLSKDRIKETLHDALGAPGSDLAWSNRLGAAAMDVRLCTCLTLWWRNFDRIGVSP